MSEDILTLADGTKIDKKSGLVISDPVPAIIEEDVIDESDDNAYDVEAIQDNLRTDKHAADLPTDIRSARPIAIVCSLSLFGLSDMEIAHVCGIEYDAVTTIKNSDKYHEFSQKVIENVMNAHSDNIRHLFTKAALPAAKEVINMLQSGIPEVKAAAAKDILDRGGFRPADIVEHRITHENELKIVYVKDDANMPTINTTYEEV